jgi:16S rRNA processing protein RimM
MDRTLTLIEATPAAPGVFVRFGEVADRASAQRLVGAYLSVEVSDTPEAAPGERRVYWDDVIGVDVRDRMGRLVGTVADCYRAGGAEVYVVKAPDGGEIDLPAVAAVIVDFDPRNGIITVDLEGSELAVRPPKRPTRSRSRVRDGANRVSSERP